MFAHESGMVPVNELFLRWLHVAQICKWIIHYYVMYTPTYMFVRLTSELRPEGRPPES